MNLLVNAMIAKSDFRRKGIYRRRDIRLTKEEITAIDLLDRNDAIADLTDVELIKKLNQLKVR